MVFKVWCGRARQVLTSALSSTSGMNRTADSESDLMVTITSTCGGKTEPCSDHWNWLDVVFCSQFVFIIRRVLLGHLNREYLRETERERDTGVSRPTCWFYYSQIQLHHNKQEAQMFLPWTTREIWQSVRGQFTRWKLLSGAWSHKSSTSWMENDPYSEFSRDLHRAAGLTSRIETVGMKPVIGSPKVTETLTCSPVHWWRWHKQASSC